jgi:hypothetical protein
VQDALAACGWTDAAKSEQQDASEAFSFIADKLELPMLTLKMDLFHVGKEDVNDDHKFIRERLLEVAIPEDRNDGQVITLEDCLETYFNSRVEVKRYLERRGTQTSASHYMSFDSTKGQAVHIESTEVQESGPSTPATGVPPISLPTYSSIRPGPHPVKYRASSIIQETMVYENDEKAALKMDLPRSNSTAKTGTAGRPRAGTLRKEIMMPAWQFFQLIRKSVQGGFLTKTNLVAWYTDIVPNNDAQVAAHLSTKRPVLGICLKRYLITTAGEPVRRGTHIDIPIEIALPQFIHDDNMADDAAAFGNFKLALQSVVCHRGDTVYAGHYVSLVRGSWADGDDKWILFDDLASERIKAIDIEKTLKEESPYLLFYQIQPIEGDPKDISRGERPPSYLSDTVDSAIAGLSKVSSLNLERRPSDQAFAETSTGRPSLDEPESYRSRGRPSGSMERRLSISNARAGNIDIPTISAENTPALSRRESRQSRYDNHSRKNSQNGEKRISRSFQNLAGKFTGLSKVESIPTIEGLTAGEPSAYAENTANFPPGAETREADPSRGKLRKEMADKSREKSRGRSTAGRHLTKSRRLDRPDRECIVM